VSGGENAGDGPSSIVYAALGDSMSVDDYAGGAGRGAASLLLRNRDEDFPDWAGRDLVSGDPGARMLMLASDGATSRDVAEFQLPSIGRRAPTMASVTMGGNDLLFAFGDSAAARRAIGNVTSNGREVLGGLRELMGPDAPIVVGTIYDPSDGTGDSGFQDLPPWPEVLDLLAELNGELRTLAESYGARVADLHARFMGHGLTEGDPGQPEARPADRNLWYCGLIEPNAWGANAIRAAFWDALAAFG
jgi:lysophospholipase L1-like esterase